MASTSPPITDDLGLTASEPSGLTMVEITRASTGIVRPSERYDSQLANSAHRNDGFLASDGTGALAARMRSFGTRLCASTRGGECAERAGDFFAVGLARSECAGASPWTAVAQRHSSAIIDFIAASVGGRL